MSDVLTTVWGFVKQTIGGNRNTWGAILNTNFDTVEAALSGSLAKAVTGGAVTLTNTERRNRILSFTGVLTSNSIITVANFPAVWIVKNGTTGAFSLSMKTASGTPVTIPQGTYVTVWCDGGDIISVGPSNLLFSTQFQAPDGTISAPGLSFLNETTLGFRRAGYATGTLGATPFTTTNTSANVTVNHTAHGLAANDTAFYSGAAAVGGITIDGQYPVVSITDADHYVITHSAPATSSTSGGGAAVTFKYMKAAASGGAIAITKGGADIAHVSPYGIILTGVLSVSGAARFLSTVSVIGLIAGATATLTGLLTGVTATFSGLLTLSSTSHMSMAGGTTAQRPGSPNTKDFRFNTDTGFIEVYTSGTWSVFESGKLPRGYIDGFVAGNGDGAGGGDQVNDITFTAGVCRDSTNTINITGAALTKQLDANWVAGTNQGMRNSAVGIADGTYHLYGVMTAAGVQDYYAHTSTNVTTVLAALQAETGGSAYIYARRLLSIVRAGATILAFTQRGDEFHLKTPVRDYNNTTSGTSALTITLGSVPAGLVVKALVNYWANSSASYVSALTETDLQASFGTGGVAPLGSSAVSGAGNGGYMEVWTNTSAQIRGRSASSSDFIVATLGWRDLRGRDA